VNDGGAARRALLWPFGCAYGALMALRNAAFTGGLLRVRRLPVPVVSVGNLTLGGTGKTPAVLWLAALARAHGRRPGVLARGYGRARGALLNDEGVLLQRRLPWLLQQQHPDRFTGGQRLLQQGADFVLLDDGFQHRRLHRDVDLLCVDAAQPFGRGGVLPAGELREFASGLRRASLLLLTRADALAATALALRIAQLRLKAGNSALPVFPCRHAPADLLREPDGTSLPLAELRGRRVVLLAAVARPAAFLQTVRALGADVRAEHRYRDHHRFTAAELARAAAAAVAQDAWLLCTEKDAARLVGDDVVRYVLRIDLAFLEAVPPPAMVGIC